MAYFKTMEGGNMYVYMFFACEDVNFSNDKAINQGSGLDEQHFAYMRECIDLSRGGISWIVFFTLTTWKTLSGKPILFPPNPLTRLRKTIIRRFLSPTV